MATGKDKSMLLRIKLSDITKDGLNFPRREKTKGKKGGKASFLPFEYEGQSTGLKEIIDDIIDLENQVAKSAVLLSVCKLNWSAVS